MYDVTVTNNYMYGVHLEIAGQPPPGPGGGYRLVTQGESVTYKNLGSGSMEVYGMGRINLIDLGNRKLDTYTSPKIPWTQMTWGGLVRYRGLDAYFRYEGQGKVSLIIDPVGSISLHFDQGGMIINLNDLTVT